MCGIAGMIGVPPEIASAAAPRLLRALSHRGPDGHGSITITSKHGRHPVFLIHTRLAILELSDAGAQPMSDQPRGDEPANVITFNGEIFNYLDLHAPLADAGWPCTSRSDTQAILHAYRVWGTAAVEHFRGMFAFALADPAAGKVWLCRDRLGVKPLYFYRPRCGGLIFASEVRALLAAGPTLVPPKLNPAAVESFLAQGAVFDRAAIVAGVEMLPTGSSLVVDWEGKEESLARYWRLPDPISTPTNDRPAAVSEVAAKLREAVRLQLISDVPLGLFLSGGIDSAVLAVVASEVAGSRLKTLTIGFEEAEYDESSTAAAVAAALGTEHSLIRMNGADIVERIPDFLATVDQPTVDGVNTFIVSDAARKAGLTVALSGLGGDELFGGYASFRDVPRSGKWQSVGRMIGPFSQLASVGLRSVGLGRRFAKSAELLQRPHDPIHRYLLRRELFLPQERRAAMSCPPGSDEYSGLSERALGDLRAESRDPDPINQVSRFELRGYMKHMLLRDSDVFSMAAGLELRVPFLDYRLVETVLRLPGHWKRPDPRPKPLLIDAAGAGFPKFLTHLPKKGFTFPWGPWFHGPLAPKANKAIHNADLWRSLGINPAAPVAVWNVFSSRDRRVAPVQPLAWLVLEDYATRHGLRR